MLIILGLMGLAVAGMVALGALYVFAVLGPVEDTVSNDAQLGECYVRGQSTPVSCAEPHHFEVFAEVRFLPEATFPGRLDRFVGIAFCEEELVAVTGDSYVLGAYDYVAVYPSEADWEAGNRRVPCVLVDSEGRLLSRTFVGQN